MLCHLVCTDRRYARMNCFNIRELQSILKRKFFTDLMNTHDHRNLLDQSMLGLRYKTNNNLNLNPDCLSFYNFGINTSNLNKVSYFLNFNKLQVSGVSTLSTWNSFFLNFFNFQNNIMFSLPLASYFTMIIDYFMFLFSFKLFYYPFFSLNVILKTIFCNFSFFLILIPIILIWNILI
jgi:hypothetical protein